MSARPARGGFTLFEIILALAVVGLGMAVISQVVWSGMENARMTQDSVQAELLAEGVMAELLAGARPLEPAEESAFGDDSGLADPGQWLFSIDVSPLDIEELPAVRVTVRANSDKPAAASYSLVRWLFVPEAEESSTEQSQAVNGQG